MPRGPASLVGLLSRCVLPPWPCPLPHADAFSVYLGKFVICDFGYQMNWIEWTGLGRAVSGIYLLKLWLKYGPANHWPKSHFSTYPLGCNTMRLYLPLEQLCLRRLFMSLRIQSTNCRGLIWPRWGSYSLSDRMSLSSWYVVPVLAGAVLQFDIWINMFDFNAGRSISLNSWKSKSATDNSHSKQRRLQKHSSINRQEKSGNMFGFPIYTDLEAHQHLNEHFSLQSKRIYRGESNGCMSGRLQ